MERIATLFINTISRLRAGLWLFACIVLLTPGSGLCAGVPAPLMVKIVLASIAFDRSIEERFGETVEIAVVGSGSEAKALAKVLGAASGKKVKGKSITIVETTADTMVGDKVDLVFFGDKLGADIAAVAARCIEQRLTCVASHEEDVTAGLPIGVAIDGGKPKLLINMDAAKACGAKFSAQILKLARLIDSK